MPGVMELRSDIVFGKWLTVELTGATRDIWILHTRWQLAGFSLAARMCVLLTPKQGHIGAMRVSSTLADISPRLVNQN